MAYDLSGTRAASLPPLARVGFEFDGLPPHLKDLRLRSGGAIARRLLAIKCAHAWVCHTKEAVATDAIRDCITRNELQSSFARDERVMLRCKRSQAQDHRPAAGLLVESAWSLAWILGHHEAPALDGLPVETAYRRALLDLFAPDFDCEIDAWVHDHTPREEESVVVLEDIFSCLVAAVQRGRAGEAQLPGDFDPVAGGAVVVARHRALLWALRETAEWDDVGADEDGDLA